MRCVTYTSAFVISLGDVSSLLLAVLLEVLIEDTIGERNMLVLKLGENIGT